MTTEDKMEAAIHDLAADLIEQVLHTVPDIPEGGFGIDTIHRRDGGNIEVVFSGIDEAATPPRPYTGTIIFWKETSGWTGGWGHSE